MAGETISESSFKAVINAPIDKVDLADWVFGLPDAEYQRCSPAHITVSLTRTVLWILSLGIFDKAYAKATSGSTDEHTYIAPDLFIAETPLGTYKGMTDQIVMSRTPGAFRTVLAPRGSSRPEWLPLRNEHIYAYARTD